MSKKTKEIIKLLNEVKCLCNANNDKVTALEQDVNALQGKAIEAQNIKVLTEEEQAAIYWPDWRDPQIGDNQFAGFVEYELSKRLEAGKLYYFEIGPVALVGEKLQMVAKFYEFIDENGCYEHGNTVGLLVQSYAIGSPEYKKMVAYVYYPPFAMLMEVRTKDISEIEGRIALKHDESGQLVLDWDTFKPEITPCCNSWFFSESLIAEMENQECESGEQSGLVSGKAA